MVSRDISSVFKCHDFRVVIKIPSGDRILKSFLDSGSDISLIKENVAKLFLREHTACMTTSNLDANSVTGDKVEIKGVINLPLKIGNEIIMHNFNVVSDLNFAGGILIGLDLLHKLNASIHFGEKNKVILNKVEFTFNEMNKLKSFESIKVVRINNITDTGIPMYKAHLTESTVIPANTAIALQAHVPSVHKNFSHSDVITTNLLKTDEIKFAKSLCHLDDKNNIFISCINISNDEIILNEGQIVADLLPFEEQFDKIPINNPKSMEEQLKKVNLSHLSNNQKDKILNVIKINNNAFSTDINPIGHITCVKHEIPTPPGIVSFQYPYRLPHHTQEIIEQTTKELLELDIIKECVSPWSSPLVLVKKKTGDWRMCVDMRKLNSLCLKNNFPIPRIDETIEAMSGKSYFTLLDAKSGYHHIDLNEEDQIKTAFRTLNRTYCYKRMPYGLKCAGFTFQQAMNMILSKVLGKYALAYIDDVCIYSNTFEEHIEHLDEVLKLLIEGGVRLSMGKCSFAQSSIDYLGFHVSGKGSSPLKSKISAIANFPQPKTQRNVRQFLATVGFYRHFIKNFAKIAVPLSELLKKVNKKFTWSQEAQSSFEILRKALTSEPILIHPNFEQTFELHCDASDYAIGSSLMQLKNGIPHPVAFYSRKLRDAELNYSTTEKEALSIISAIKHFHYYIYLRHFKVLSDHMPLKQMLCSQSKNQRINRWVDYLLGYDYEIEYKAGKYHHLPDALSRNVAVNINTLKNPHFAQSKIDLKKEFDIDNVIKEQLKEGRWSDIINYLKGDVIAKIPSRSSLDSFFISDDCLYYSGNSAKTPLIYRLVIPQTLIKAALYLVHDDFSSAHAGFLKTLFKARSMFYWPTMVPDIKKYVTDCMPCQRRKPGLKFKSKLGKFPPITVPNHTIGCDLVGPLSQTVNGNKYVLTIVDHFSRFIHLYPIINKETITVTKALVTHCVRHGPPVYIVSDLGSEFISQLWKDVCNNLNIKLNYTTSYRPMTNGLVENKNRFFIDHVHFLMSESPQEWDEQLPYTAAAMNAALCKPINETPFYVYHGRDYHYNYSKALNNTHIPYTADTDYNIEMAARLSKAFKSVAESDLFHKNQYEKTYNKNLKIHALTPGSLVWVRNETKISKLGRKFAPRFLGPYRILGFESENRCHIKAIHFNHDKVQLVHTDRLKPCHILKDTYPKFADLITDFDDRKKTGQVINNDNTNNISPDLQTEQQSLEKHNYNLRKRN